MADQNIRIVISQSGAIVVKNEISQVGKTSETSASAVDLLKAALVGLAGVFAVQKIREYADAWASATGLIKIATKTMGEATAVTNQLFDAAQQTRGSFEALVSLYSSAARAGGQLGATQQQLITFSKGVGEALAVQHVTASQASGALLQLGQALDLGKIRSQEFNSIVQQAPAILQTAAKGLGQLDGNISGLRARMLAGTLSSKQFFDAFLAGLPELEKDFAKSNFTIGQGLTLISNSFEKLIGEFYESSGAAEIVGKSARFIAENLKQIVGIAIAVGAALAVAFAPAIISIFATQVKALFVLIASNPFLALAAAIAGVIVYLYEFGDAMNAGIDSTTSINDVFRAFFQEVTSGFRELLGVAQEIFTGLLSVATDSYSAITGTTSQATKDWQGSYSAFYADTKSGFAGVLQSIAKTIDAIAGLLTGLGIAVVRTFAGLPAVFTSIFGQIYNAVVDKVEGMINATINGVNKLRSIVGTQLIDTVKISRKDVDVDAWKKYGQGIAASIDDGFDTQGGFLLKSVNNIFDKAQKIGADRTKALAGDAAANLNASMGSGHTVIDPNAAKEAAKAAKEIEKLQNQLRGLLNTIYPADGATLELAKAQKTLTAAVAKHLITQEQADKYLILAKQHYDDIIHPLEKVNRDIDDQTRLLKLSAQARAVETQVMQTQQALLQAGQPLNDTELAQLRAKLTVQQELARLSQAKDQLQAGGSGQKSTDFDTQLQAIKSLMADKSSGFNQNDAFKAGTSGLDQSLFAGTKEAYDANVANYKAMTDQINALQQAGIISEATAATAKSRIFAQQHATEISAASTALGNLATLQSSHNKKQAAIGKAAAIAQATINTYTAATGAYSALASIPYVGPFLGIAAAAAAIVAGLANVQQIRSTNYGAYQYGGGFTVGGQGSTDSQNVSFRATPGERVSIHTPNQARALEQSGKGSQQQQAPKITMVNVTSDDQLRNFLNSDDGEQIVVNHMNKNGFGSKF